MTIQALATGCKSGMGTFLRGRAGIVNFAPQLTPLGDTRAFGLAGKPLFLKLEENRLNYQTRLAAPHGRPTGLDHLKDSGFSGLWIETEAEILDESLQLRCTIDGVRSLEECTFVFFGKGEACFVSGSHKLNPRSLDRYQGPPQELSFVAGESSVSLNPQEGFSRMEVIPLAGDDTLWGADFLVAFTCLEIKDFSTYSEEKRVPGGVCQFHVF